MGGKYAILARNYDSEFYDCECKYRWLLPALLRFVSLCLSTSTLSLNYENRRLLWDFHSGKLLKS